ncbi:MAG: hypothetical protein WC360_07885 [Opitutales bacterium]
MPRPIFYALVNIGALIAMLCMKRQREASFEYLRTITGREPTWRDQWKHFASFAQSLITRLIAGKQKNVRLIHPSGHGDQFMELVRSGAQVLYGTFHIGCPDLLGFSLADGYCPISMIRLKVGNSHDVERFTRHYKGLGLNLIWVNNPQDVIFGINAAIRRKDSIAMQCDRVDYSSRNESFLFIGARRIFPFTIYHLSAIYRLPVAFCVSFNTPEGIVTHAPAPFHPEGTKKEVLRKGKKHFQQVLREVETLLTDYPYQWFNFDCLNPISSDEYELEEQHDAHAE